MDYFIFAAPLIGSAIVMGGIILMNRDSKNTPYVERNTIKDCVSWGSGFFIAFSTEFMLLASV